MTIVFIDVFQVAFFASAFAQTNNNGFERAKPYEGGLKKLARKISSLRCQIAQGPKWSETNKKLNINIKETMKKFTKIGIALAAVGLMGLAANTALAAYCEWQYRYVCNYWGCYYDWFYICF